MKQSIRPFLSIFLVFLSVLALCLGLRNEPFFWDTTQLGAMQGDWFFQNNFQTFLLPDHIDSGHIPFFGWYLALMWHFFGQNLLVSHLAMLPWCFLLISELLFLLKSHNFVAGKLKKYFFLLMGLSLFLVDPVFISQLSLISPDVVLLAAFLLAINSIHRKNNLLLSIAVVLLGLISLRGIMVAFSLFIWQLVNQFSKLKSSPWLKKTKLLQPYLAGAFIVILYFIFHYYQKGWIGVHSDSPWAASFAGVGFKGLFKQAAILDWRILDYGRVFLWLGIGIVCLRLYKTQIIDEQLLEKSVDTQSFISLAIILFIILGLPAVISAGLSQHRYLLPFFIIVTFVFWQLLQYINQSKWLYVIWSIAFLGLATGNYWVYPHQIAQGWDSTLAHKPYFEGKEKLYSFLADEGIPLPEIGTVFPEVGSLHDRYLNNRKEGFQALDMKRQQYVFYSNVMNDFSDKQLEILGILKKSDTLKKTTWKPIFQFNKRGVNIILFQKK